MEHFISFKNMDLQEPLPGAFFTSFQTQHLTVAYTDMKTGAVIPLHHHPEEAVDIILNGTLEMQIGDRTDTLTHGMMSWVPSNVPHQAKAVTDCKVITIFNPKRAI